MSSIDNQGINNQRKNIGMVLVLGLVLVVVAIVTFFFLVFATSSEPLPVSRQIQSFELEEATGETYQSDNGKIKLVSFLLLNCPDGVCPMTMSDFSDLQKELKEDGLFGKEVELVAITFDPERDDIQSLKEYSTYFDADLEGWKFLRGSEEQIKALSDDLGYSYFVGEDGSAMHATTMYILDGKHQIRAYHKMTTRHEQMNKEAIMKDIRQLVKE
ncbi:SCO family protein [Caldalkalibacillus mannanilyticus]|uniref:SCO family protein n=1 Tax=Caldalkalibacillus mannanilyticus TaxID=1418 RepID=UPI00046AD888|nr:SCO family protein [Caldalkalibacillus mannanilyticus]